MLISCHVLSAKKHFWKKLYVLSDCPSLYIYICYIHNIQYLYIYNIYLYVIYVIYNIYIYIQYIYIYVLYIIYNIYIYNIYLFVIYII